MNYSKPYAPREFGSLKEAQAALVTACGGQIAAADLCKKAGRKCSQAQIQRYTAVDKPPPAAPCNMPADIVALLEWECKKPIVTRFLAEELDCVLEPVETGTQEPISVIVGRITEDTGQILSAAAHDMQRGELTVANAAQVLKETDDLLPAMLLLRGAARAVVSKRGAQ